MQLRVKINRSINELTTLTFLNNVIVKYCIEADTLKAKYQHIHGSLWEKGDSPMRIYSYSTEGPRIGCGLFPLDGASGLHRPTSAKCTG